MVWRFSWPRSEMKFPEVEGHVEAKFQQLWGWRPVRVAWQGYVGST
jgi:hypothetical protein